jgi:hypothetical protein
MAMIFDSANRQRLHPVLASDTTHVRPQPRLHILWNRSFTILRRKDVMDEKAAEGVGHWREILAAVPAGLVPLVPHTPATRAKSGRSVAGY